MRLFRNLLAAFALMLPVASWAETYLLMAEEHGCMWCLRWDEEIAHKYPKTSEGQAAPLMRYDLLNGTPEGFVLERKVRFTPTFILVQDGVEKGRIEGYPGEDFFWPLLAELLRRAGIPFEAAG